MKITRDELIEVLGLDKESVKNDPGLITLSAGKFTLRREYYWRPRGTPEEVFAKTLAKLKEAGYEVSNIEYGNKYNPFRGGEGVKHNAHYWLNFKATKTQLIVP